MNELSNPSNTLNACCTKKLFHMSEFRCDLAHLPSNEGEKKVKDKKERKDAKTQKKKGN